ncbi:MAG: hypothetical protein WCS52_05560 [bacterium]
MSASPLTGQQRGQEALTRATDCIMKAIHCLDEGPINFQWKRIQNASLCFKGLPLDHLPEKLERHIDITFRRINAVLARYPIKTWDDYQNIAPDDLKKIESLIRGLI